MSNKFSGLIQSNYESNRITRESIQEAFLYLLSKKSIKDITVTEIVQKAGVSRGAYYKNYSTKEDILHDFSSNVFDIIKSCLEDEEYTTDPFKWFSFLFNALKPNEKLLKLLIKTDIYPTFKFYNIDTSNLSTTELYEYEFFDKGLSAIIIKWINDGLTENPDDMARLCARLFKGTSIIFSTAETEND